ncbi:hypothetical protein [Acrocarpospora catenulata]|uniref:hypothetical protein n=1 Tax=Acrocarpospora catenulata TaxID=2836182 RepID=UPI001BDA5319|nr:hypothetical protein [Acrocarpospora catenulata]
MNRIRLGVAALAGLAALLPATVAGATAGNPGPEICRQGYVWRTARPSDLVCVTPGNRDQTLLDNSVKRTRWTNGVDGRHTCLTGYVWREAFDGDDVCVHPVVHDQAAKDNAAGPSRRVAAKVWVTTYQENVAKLKVNGSYFNFGPVKIVIRFADGRTAWAGTLYADARPSYPGGSFGRRTGMFDCSGPGKPANGYARAYDVRSGRWSDKVPVRIGCATL